MTAVAPTATRAPGNARAARSDSRERILAASLKLVARKGYVGTSIAMICAEAGLNASSLYWHFASKEELFLSAIRDGADEFLGAVALPAGDADDRPVPDNDDLARTVAARLQTNANFLRLLLIMMLEDDDLSASFRTAIAEIRAQSLAWWCDLLERRFGALGATTAAILAADFAPLCRACLNGAFIAQQHGEAVDLEAVMRQLLLLLNALVEKIAREQHGETAPPRSTG